MNLKDMIAAGRYDQVSPVITEDNFPMPANLVLGTEPKLFSYSEGFHPDSTYLDKKLLAEMDRQGYRPANLWELLNYGSKNPSEQLKHPIIALGSEHREYVPELSYTFPLKKGDPCRRLLGVDSKKGNSSTCRFLGVRK
jgi:hypothetical protein